MAPIIRALVAAVAVLAGAAPQPPEPRQNPVVVFETEKGAIEMEVDSVHAPATAANFLKYVDGGFFEGGSVNRAVRPDNTVRHDVEIQAKDSPHSAASSAGWMWSERFRLRRPVDEDPMGPSRLSRRSES